MKNTEQNPVVRASNDDGSIVQIDIGSDDHEGEVKGVEEETQKGVATAAESIISSDNELETDIQNVIFDENTANATETKPAAISCLNKILAFYFAFDFPIHILIFIGLAKAYPELGAETLKPKITAGWIATGIIFFLSGLGLKTANLITVVFGRFYFNAYVEIFNFFVVSSFVFGISRALSASGALPQPFADGMAICACLPMSINAVIVLTTSAGGDEAAAILHSAFGNFVGIFLSPILIVLYLPGATANVDLPTVFKDLTFKVILPLIGGQLVHIFILRARDFYFAHKKFFKKTQEWSLVYIVYTIFCRTFLRNDGGLGFGNIAIVIVFIFLCQTSMMTLTWYIMKLLFRNEPGLRVMGTYGCVSKTIALGIPLILSIFGGTEFESYYTLPILIWHPMALVVGSTLVGRMKKFIISEKERLGIPEESAYFAASKRAKPTAEERV